MHLLRFLLVALAAVSCCQAEPNCTGYISELTVDIACTNLVDLTPLTAELATTEKPLHELTISASSRLTLKREDVDTPRLLDIVELDLSSNGWTSFNSEPIQVLPKLEKLILSRNNLTAITANTFAGLKSLTQLSLDNNLIETIDPAAFQSLTKLTYLDLDQNLISTIPPGLFSGLSLFSIELRRNVLTSIDAETFNGVTNLTILVLLGNQIETIDPVAFQSLTKLNHLDLESNRISTIPPGLFSGLPLQSIDLSRNVLTSIDDDTFNNIPGLIKLDLSGNKIKTIDSRAFQTLPVLGLVQLDDNELESLDSRLFENNHIVILDLTENNLENLANFSLNSTSLLGLGLNKCNITSIPDDYFKNVPNLYILSLQNNHISKLQPGLLSPMSNLGILLLDFNALTSLNVASFEQIHELLISPERTLELPPYFKTKLLPAEMTQKVVRLGNNPWDCSSPDMVELKAWCKQHDVDFNRMFTCTVD